MRLLAKIFATSASVIPNASAKPAMSANEGWLIASGWFGCDLMLKSCASGRLSRRLRYRSMTARCRGVGVASAASAEPCASLLLSTKARHGLARATLFLPALMESLWLAIAIIMAVSIVSLGIRRGSAGVPRHP